MQTAWTITYNPPPIPSRNCDWQFVHRDYDGPDSPAWMSGHGSSREDCESQIADIEEGL